MLPLAIIAVDSVESMERAMEGATDIEALRAVEARATTVTVSTAAEATAETTAAEVTAEATGEATGEAIAEMTTEEG